VDVDLSCLPPSIVVQMLRELSTRFYLRMGLTPSLDGAYSPQAPERIEPVEYPSPGPATKTGSARAYCDGEACSDIEVGHDPIGSAPSTQNEACREVAVIFECRLLFFIAPAVWPRARRNRWWNPLHVGCVLERLGYRQEGCCSVRPDRIDSKQPVESTHAKTRNRTAARRGLIPGSATECLAWLLRSE